MTLLRLSPFRMLLQPCCSTRVTRAILAAVACVAQAVSADDASRRDSPEGEQSRPANSVDLRPAFEKWGLEPRPQGGRGTCSVFTVVGAVEYALADKEGAGKRLSVEFLNWASNRAIGQTQDGGFFSDLWKGFETFGICPEEEMPYRPEFDPALRPSEAALKHARRVDEAGVRLHWIKPWNPNTGLTDAELAEIKQTLRCKWPVCGGFRWPKRERWSEGVLAMAPPEGVRDGHSVLLVGFRDDPAQPGGGVFLILNSGKGLRNGSMTYEYVRTYMNDAVWIDHGPEAPAAILDMDAPRHRPTTSGPENKPIGSVEVVKGRFGKACRFDFPEGKGFFTASVPPSSEWDRAEGISFWVKGDGSKSWSGLELIDASDYRLRYGYCFPIDSTEWRRIDVPWCDLVPELPAGSPVDAKEGYPPSKFGNVWFGKWYYWGDYPAHSFAVDQIALEPSIPVDRSEDLPAEAGTPGTLAKLKTKEPVTIVTLGDSLSDKRHWANREVLWSELLAGKLGERFGGRVELVNPAIGGTQLTQNLVLMPRWLDKHPRPDLVTVWFGYNDWDSGMRREQFERMLRFAVDRIRRMTGGKSEILLMTTCPALGRWDTMEELAEAVRTVARQKRTGLADVSAAFHKAGADPQSRAPLYCRDGTHLGPQGHELAAETVAGTIGR